MPNTFPERARTTDLTTPSYVTTHLNDATPYTANRSGYVSPGNDYVVTWNSITPSEPVPPSYVEDIKTRLSAIEKSLNTILEYLELPTQEK